MTTKNTNETSIALLTAGLMMLAVGAMLATFPNGQILGLVIAVAGAVFFVVFTIRIWRDRRKEPRRDASEPKDPDRFWNAEARLVSLMSVSGTATIATIVLAILHPTQDKLSLLWINVPILVASGIAFLLVRGNNRRKDGQRNLGGS